jgi:protein-S-isoprenylcysteine O-methyltransferase Ste14
VVTGAIGAVFFAVVQITAKRLRNRALVRRGEPPYRDCVFILSPFLLAFGVLGALAGAIAAAVTGAWWPVSALAAAGPPALLAVVFVVFAARQARGSPTVDARPDRRI